MSEASHDAHPGVAEEHPLVSVPRRPLSRRALMKAAAIAPIIALGREAWARPTPGIMAALARAVPVPEDQLVSVKEKVGNNPDSPTNFDYAKLELVVRVLWAHFHYGSGGVPVKEGVKLLEVMYEAKTNDDVETGARLAAAITAGNFDPLGNDYQTNVCAYICGHKAALEVSEKPPGEQKIDKAIYENARTATENEMKKKLLLARNGSGPPLGFGC